jgi:hypothetical protein
MDIENTDLDDNSIRLAEATVSNPLRGEQPTADRAVSAE